MSRWHPIRHGIKIAKRTQSQVLSDMSSMKQVTANRQNARCSAGPVTAEGKKRSRCNAVRHGLTAETVIGALEDAEDYAAFEMAIIADYDAQSAIERELALRLASVLWRLRRATSIESGLFEIEARQLLRVSGRRRMRKNADNFDEATRMDGASPLSLHGGANVRVNPSCKTEPVQSADRVTASFLRLSKLPTYPLDRLSRYEANLWRQACQILFALQYLGRRKAWERVRHTSFTASRYASSSDRDGN